MSAHGHNVAPARLEPALQDACPLILQACAIGEGRPHMAAIVAIDPVLEQDETVSGIAGSVVTKDLARAICAMLRALAVAELRCDSGADAQRCG